KTTDVAERGGAKRHHKSVGLQGERPRPGTSKLPASLFLTKNGIRSLPGAAVAGRQRSLGGGAGPIDQVTGERLELAPLAEIDQLVLRQRYRWRDEGCGLAAEPTPSPASIKPPWAAFSPSSTTSCSSRFRATAGGLGI